MIRLGRWRLDAWGLATDTPVVYPDAASVGRVGRIGRTTVYRVWWPWSWPARLAARKWVRCLVSGRSKGETNEKPASTIPASNCQQTGQPSGKQTCGIGGMWSQ
jgi:hypothetical protein